MRPLYGRISTHMSFDFEMFGRISAERLVSVDAKSSCRASPCGAATVTERCPAYDRFTVSWLSFLSLSAND